MKATFENGQLAPIENCYLYIPGYGKLTLYSLPDLSDSKSASYNDEPIIGRAFPLKTYSHSENRTISLQIHLYVQRESDISFNIRALRAITSMTYPRDSTSTTTPYLPPPVCKIRCGSLLADQSLCVVLKSYSFKPSTDVPWDARTLMPWKLDIDTTWDVVYKSSNLPGQERILNLGG